MTTTSIRETTTARYQGLKVTIVGDTRAGLLAIAGYGTTHERAIATIEVKSCHDRRAYRVAGGLRWTDSLQAVAEHAVEMRDTRDAHRR